MADIPTIADFRAPPVVEVVCGVQFDPLAEFRSAHVGLFWHQVRETYAIARDTFSLPSVVENLGPPSAQPQTVPIFQFGAGAQAPRVQLVDERGGQMIQIQNGRFHHNWEKQSREHQYRRYKNIRPAFVERWEEFKAFLKSQALGDVRPTQYELSYVNHVPAGELWDPTRGLAEIIPWFAPPPSAEGTTFEPQFAMCVPEILRSLFRKLCGLPERRDRRVVAGLRASAWS